MLRAVRAADAGVDPVVGFSIATGDGGPYLAESSVEVVMVEFAHSLF